MKMLRAQTPANTQAKKEPSTSPVGGARIIPDEIFNCSRPQKRAKTDERVASAAQPIITGAGKESFEAFCGKLDPICPPLPNGDFGLPEMGPPKLNDRWQGPTTRQKEKEAPSTDLALLLKEQKTIEYMHRYAIELWHST